MCVGRRHGGSFVLVSAHRPPVAPWRASAGGGVVAADRRSRHRLSSDSPQGPGPYRAAVPPVRAVAPLLVLCALAFAGEVSSEPRPSAWLLALDAAVAIGACVSLPWWWSRLRPTALVLVARSEEHTSELQSLMRISYAVFCLKTK